MATKYTLQDIIKDPFRYARMNQFKVKYVNEAAPNLVLLQEVTFPVADKPYFSQALIVYQVYYLGIKMYEAKQNSALEFSDPDFLFKVYSLASPLANENFVVDNHENAYLYELPEGKSAFKRIDDLKKSLAVEQRELQFIEQNPEAQYASERKELQEQLLKALAEQIDIEKKKLLYEHGFGAEEIQRRTNYQFTYDDEHGEYEVVWNPEIKREERWRGFEDKQKAIYPRSLKEVRDRFLAQGGEKADIITMEKILESLSIFKEGDVVQAHFIDRHSRTKDPNKTFSTLKSFADMGLIDLRVAANDSEAIILKPLQELKKSRVLHQQESTRDQDDGKEREH